MDFVVVKDPTGAWSAYAIELNLRKGGTTHPFLTLQFLTDGHYEADSGKFLQRRGREKHLVATDHLEADELRALSVDDLFDVVARHGLHFDQARQAGVVFHMISSLTECGRVGMTAIGDTPDRRGDLRPGRAGPARRGPGRAAGVSCPGRRSRPLAGSGLCTGSGTSRTAAT